MDGDETETDSESENYWEIMNSIRNEMDFSKLPLLVVS